jgi:uncharacterized protein YjbI with pentapeptide repeats
MKADKPAKSTQRTLISRVERIAKWAALILSVLTFGGSGVVLGVNYIVLADQSSHLQALSTVVVAVTASAAAYWVVPRAISNLIARAIPPAIPKAFKLLLPDKSITSWRDYLDSIQLNKTAWKIYESFGSLGKIVLRSFIIFLMASGIVSLLAMLLAVMHFMLVNMQVSRLTEQNKLLGTQNDLLSTQNDLLIATTKTKDEIEQAAREFDTIRTILLNPESAVESQVYALKQLPSAMVRPVYYRYTSGNSTVQYPNLEPLKELLLEYVRFDRIGYRLHQRGIHWDAEIPITARALSEIADLEPVSTQILRVLHTLGPAGLSGDVWSFVPDGKTEAPPLRPPLDGVLQIKSRLHPYIGALITLDLRHLDRKTLNRAQLPCAFRGFENYAIIFPNSMEFDHSCLEGWFCVSITASNAQFVNARLEHSIFLFANLQGSSFQQTFLDGTAIDNGNMSSCTFYYASMCGVLWDNVKCKETSFTHCTAHRSRFERADFRASEFFDSQFCFSSFARSLLSVALMTTSNFDGCQFDHADLSGVTALDVSMNGASFEEANLSSSRLSSVFLAGARLIDTKLNNAQLDSLFLEGRTISYSAIDVNMQDYWSNPPTQFYSQRETGGTNLGRIDSHRIRRDDTLVLFDPQTETTSQNRNAPRISITYPGCLLYRLSGVAESRQISFLQIPVGFDVACHLWFLQENTFEDFSTTEAWSRLPFDANGGKINIPGLEFRHETMGGKANIVDHSSGEFMIMGTGENASWIDKSTLDQFQKSIDLAKEESPEKAAAAEALIKAGIPAEGLMYLKRLEWYAFAEAMAQLPKTEP